MPLTHTMNETVLKDGGKVPIGSPIIAFDKEYPTICHIQLDDGRIVKCRIRSVLKQPTKVLLERWAMDSVCESVLGNTVEPDGRDEHGAPSWLLAMGMI